MTDDEARGVLDERLAASVGEFDQMILSERSRIGGGQSADDEAMRAVGGSDDGAGGEEYSGGPLFEEADLADDDGYPAAARGEDEGLAEGMDGQDGSGAAGSGEVPGGLAGTAGSPRRAGGGGPDGEGAHGAIPQDIPSGEDDDIVARQIREAAINEPDPELREKLWDEYRSYKGLN